MKKTLLPILLVLAVALSACEGDTPTSVPDCGTNPGHVDCQAPPPPPPPPSTDCDANPNHVDCQAVPDSVDCAATPDHEDCPVVCEPPVNEAAITPHNGGLCVTLPCKADANQLTSGATSTVWTISSSLCSPQQSTTFAERILCNEVGIFRATNVVCTAPDCCTTRSLTFEFTAPESSCSATGASCTNAAECCSGSCTSSVCEASK